MKWKRAVFYWFNCQVAFRRLCLLRHRSGQVRLGSWIISFGLRGPSPQAFTPFRGGLGSLPGAWGAPNKGNAEGAEGIFGKLRARVGYGPAPGPTQKKGLVPYMPVRWGVHQILQYFAEFLEATLRQNLIFWRCFFFYQ